MFKKVTLLQNGTVTGPASAAQDPFTPPGNAGGVKGKPVCS
jgi:hypothetical protein